MVLSVHTLSNFEHTPDLLHQRRLAKAVCCLVMVVAIEESRN